MHAGFDPGRAARRGRLGPGRSMPWCPGFRCATSCRAGCRVVQVGPDPLFADDAGARLPVRPGARRRRGGEPRGARRRPSRPLARAAAASSRAPRAARRAPCRARAPELARGGRGGARAADDRPPSSAATPGRGLAGGRDPVLRARLRSGGDELHARRQLFRPSARRAASAGACRRRWAPSWPIRDRTVVATVGDGSYLFANPVACHQVAEALDLPILTVVINNGVWNAVRQDHAPGLPGRAMRRAATRCRSPRSSRRRTTRMIARASRGHGERVETPG